MRNIPVTMATQHPDNAGIPPFVSSAFVSTAEEIGECVQCFQELGVQEYMWDWEGKFVDEAVIDRLLSQYHEFFKKNQIGKDIFLTFRIPNIWEEQAQHRLQRAFMNIISAEQAAKNYGLHFPPLFEVILPMTASSDQLIQLQEMFSRIASATENIFDMKSVLKHIELIPLFEEISIIAHSDEILQEYVDFLAQKYDYHPEYLRVFIARSDPAMNAGLIPTMMTIKEALSKYHAFGERNNIEIFPWIGGGSLPFRGAINPENVREVIDEYKGTGSVTIQSAFRTDYPMEDVKKAITILNKEIPLKRKDYIRVSPEECKQIEQFGQKAGKIFRSSIEELAETINDIASHLPSHRERVQHVGLFGYSRGVGKVTLPRAIKFTGSLYSLGIPPEFIGAGRALRLAKDQGMLPLVQKLYVNLKRDMIHAGKYVNKENLDLLCEVDKAWIPVREDIQEIERILKIHIEPETDAHFLHRNVTSNIYRRYRMGVDFSADILEAAKIRKSLG